MNQSPSNWHHSNRYEKFWQAYNYFMSFANRQINQSYLRNWNEGESTNIKEKESRSKKRNRKSRSAQRRRARERRKLAEMNSAAKIKEPVPEDDSIMEDIEIDQEFLAFLQITLKHKEERKKLRMQKLKETEKGEELTPMDILPKEHPEIFRTRELKALYGEAADRIHAMETAMQLSFDRFSCVHGNSFWPNIPLNIMF